MHGRLTRQAYADRDTKYQCGNRQPDDGCRRQHGQGNDVFFEYRDWLAIAILRPINRSKLKSSEHSDRQGSTSDIPERHFMPRLDRYSILQTSEHG